ncbi:MAG: MBL fold metallo-hydrolase [Lachnospiraceae bacterium]|nr:MBL fold metallo-hydrolase [Lachnospiraceae bacterium]
MIKYIGVCVGPIQTNCYIVYNDETMEAIIIDPGDEAERIARKILSKNLKPVAILLTHGHFDHISAADELRAKYGVKIYAPKADKEYLRNATLNLSLDFENLRVEVNADVFLEDGQELDFIGKKIKCIETPGHTPGGMCFLFSAPDNLLFAGDTLFRDSHGRTDFYGGSIRDLRNSIVDKLFVLPDETEVFPGHGPSTDIGYEKKYNMILWG